MSGRGNEGVATALAAGLLGLGLGVAVGTALSAPSDRRSAFVEALRVRLSPWALGVVGAELGRDADHLVWVLTLQLQNQGVITLRAPLAPETLDPYSAAVLDDIVGRVSHYYLQLPR